MDDEKPRLPAWTPNTRFLGWRDRKDDPADRRVTRPVSKEDARQRALVRIPPDHPDIPF